MTALGQSSHTAPSIPNCTQHSRLGVQPLQDQSRPSQGAENTQGGPGDLRRWLPAPSGGPREHAQTDDQVRRSHHPLSSLDTVGVFTRCKKMLRKRKPKAAIIEVWIICKSFSLGPDMSHMTIGNPQKLSYYTECANLEQSIPSKLRTVCKMGDFLCDFY
eukprot:6372199-Amphidinium_carterae.1